MKFVALVSGGKDSCYNTMEVSTGTSSVAWYFIALVIVLYYCCTTLWVVRPLSGARLKMSSHSAVLIASVE